jgi:hypothetical protein
MVSITISTNNGITWTQTTLNNQWTYSLTINGNNIFAAAYSGIYFSTNNGINWTQTTLAVQYVWSLASSGNNIFAGTYQSGVWMSTNNGINWTQTALDSQIVLSLAAIGNNIFAGTYNGVFLSTNNGTTWIQRNQGFNGIPNIKSLLISNNYIFVGTDGYSVWRRDLSEIVGVKQISEIIPEKYSLSQNYPNPFNPSTKIRFSIPPFEGGQGGMTVLKVYDILGIEIATLVNEKLQPGTYEVPFSINQFSDYQLPTGVYFYRLITDGYSETKKMVLLK